VCDFVSAFGTLTQRGGFRVVHHSVLARSRHLGLVQRVRDSSAQAQFTMFCPAIGTSGCSTILQGLLSVQPQ
jgi:hypothetical protein